MMKQKYRFIIEFIRGRIASGEWPIGSRLPSQRELAKQFSVNRSTVITALEELTAEGLIEARIGMGTVVINNTWSVMQKGNLANWNENVRLGSHQASMAMVQAINDNENNDGLIQLSKGELSKELFPLAQMKAVIHKVSGELTPFGYEEPKGNWELRKAISDFLQKKGITASPSSILIVSGALQALQLIAIGLLQKGSIVYLEKPSYIYSLSTFQSAGMELFGLPMDAQGISVEQLESNKRYSRKAVLYTIPAFHNPTGLLTSDQRRKELLQLAAQSQLPVIEDDVYGDLWLDERPPLPLKAEDKFGNVLYIGSLSKTLSPGLRIGWLVGPQPVVERLADLKMQTDYGSSSLSQKVALEWISSGKYEQHLIFVRKQLKQKRDMLVTALNEYLGEKAQWSMPKGGFFIWVKLRTSLSSKEIHKLLLAKGVLINPGTIYGQQTPPAYFRLSYAYESPEKIREGIRQLGEIIKGEQQK